MIPSSLVPFAVAQSIRNLVRQPRRTAAALCAIGFGVVALLIAGGFIEWILADMREATIHSRLGHIEIVKPGYFEYGISDPSRYLLPSGTADQQAVENEPGVRTLAPRLTFSGLISHQDTTLSFIGEGVSGRRESALAGSLIFDHGSRLGDDTSRQVALGAGLARNLGVAIGDSVVVIVTKPSGGIDAVELTVVGIFSSVSKAYDDVALRMPIRVAEQLLHMRGSHMWVVLLDSTEKTSSVVEDLRRKLPARQYQVVPWYRLADFYRKTSALFSRQVGVVEFIIAAIIVLSVTNVMIMNVMERTTDVGTSLAVGVTRSRIFHMFLVEGMTLGIVGACIGILTGLGIAAVISLFGIPMPAPPGMAHGYVARIAITPRLAGAAFTLAVMAASVASVYPAWRASRLNIVDALRHRR